MKALERDGRVEITPLSAQLGVTRVTIRSDLDDLQMRGLLVRTHGGAVLPENQHLVRTVGRTLHERREEKEAIGELAVALVKPGDTILIDSGSTTAVLARSLKGLQLAVITNSVLVLQELAASASIELLVAGGALRRPDMALIGETAGSVYEQVHPDIVFLGATGFSMESGVTCANLIEAETKKRMVRAGQKICLLVDSSKLGKVSLAHVCGWEDIDALITDRLGPEETGFLEKKGVEVMTPRGGKA